MPTMSAIGDIAGGILGTLIAFGIIAVLATAAVLFIVFIYQYLTREFP